jgi:hypothetical protein
MCASIRHFGLEGPKKPLIRGFILWFFSWAGPIITPGRGSSLILPCDWRFLPKLGPLRLTVRGPFFVFKGSMPPCHAYLREAGPFEQIYCANPLCDAA